jgi:hypothetical protein
MLLFYRGKAERSSNRPFILRLSTAGRIKRVLELVRLGA